VRDFIASLLCGFLLFACNTGLCGQDLLGKWEEFSRSTDSRELCSWLRMRARCELTGERCSPGSGVVTPPFYGRLGIFVTLRTGGRVRGCYGAFSHDSVSLDLVLVRYLEGALTGDPRHEPITGAELEDTEIIVTVASQPVPVDDLLSVDPGSYGIMLTFENGSDLVFVPAEVRTTSYLKKVVAGRQYQARVFRAVTLK